MLKNDQLAAILKAATILLDISTYITDTNNTDLQQNIIDDSARDLLDIFTEVKLAKEEHSRKANAWNKAHPERHNEINKLSARRRK